MHSTKCRTWHFRQNLRLNGRRCTGVRKQWQMDQLMLGCTSTCRFETRRSRFSRLRLSTFTTLVTLSNWMESVGWSTEVRSMFSWTHEQLHDWCCPVGLRIDHFSKDASMWTRQWQTKDQWRFVRERWMLQHGSTEQTTHPRSWNQWNSLDLLLSIQHNNG